VLATLSPLVGGGEQNVAPGKRVLRVWPARRFLVELTVGKVNTSGQF
jgi:hypothetical protein